MVPAAPKLTLISLDKGKKSCQNTLKTYEQVYVQALLRSWILDYVGKVMDWKLHAHTKISVLNLGKIAGG